MLPNPKWLDALTLPLKVNVAVALAATLLLILDLVGFLNFSPLGVYTRPVLIILAIVFGCISVVGLIDYLLAPMREKQRQKKISTRRAIRRQEQEEQRNAQREAIIARLDHLSDREISFVANALRNDSPTFYTYVHSPAVTMLQGKGLVWTPGGQHHRDHYPFSFNDFVWVVLLERKDEFITKDEEHKRAEAARREADQRRHF